MDPYLYSSDERGLREEQLLLSETLFHCANGYLGVRGNLEEGLPEGKKTIRGMYINGFYDILSMPQAEKLHGLIEEKQTMVNVADTQSIRLILDGEPFSLWEGTLTQNLRTLDMRRGVTRREIAWKSPAGKSWRICFTRMASFVRKNLFLIRCELTPLDADGEVQVISGHVGEVSNFFDPSDPRVAGDASQYLHVTSVKVSGDASFLTAATSRSGLKVTSAAANRMEGAGEHTFTRGEASVEDAFGRTVKAGETAILYKYTVLCDSLRHDDCESAAQETLQELLQTPADTLFAEQSAYLERFWDNCALTIRGDDALQMAVCFNLYELLQSASGDAYGNIAAKGLSGEGYEGHYFWDTEMYMQPFFALNAREGARNLIRFRHRTLPYARENARAMGHRRGALYPWRTIMGTECSGYFPSGTAAYHINGAVASAVISYYLASDDRDFMVEAGAEILIETARLWADMGVWYKGSFHLNEVTGPDEYTCMVNDNYYTNAIARYNLEWAEKAIRLLQESADGREVLERLHVTPDEAEEFARDAAGMCLLYDEELGINPQDDSFLQKKVWDLASTPKEDFPLLMHYHPLTLYRHQVCKQADTVMAHFILEDYQDLETIRRSYAYYEAITTHDSSLSTCIFSIMAARLGMTEKAYSYFGESAKTDLFNTHGNTKDGIHTANMGGTYMAIVYGFGGLRLKESGLTLRPRIPAAWQSYQFRLHWHDTRLMVTVEHGRTVIEKLGGEPAQILVYDRPYTLADRLEIATEERRSCPDGRLRPRRLRNRTQSSSYRRLYFSSR